MQRLKALVEFLQKTFIILFVAQLLYIIALRWVDPPITVIQLMSWIEGDGLKRDYVAYEDISPNAPLAVMAAEDQIFPDHNGFDWKSIEKAMENNKTKKRIRGASTISQQVAKNVFLWQGQSVYTKWFRKGLEAYFTFMIEAVWGKKRILEVYLNVSEMGKGVFGIEAASRKYFKKSAKKLTQTEAAMIAASLPNPKKYTVKPQSRYISKRYPWVLQQMNNLRGDPEIDALLEPANNGKTKK
ncbi:monofunctional biosynthetic peptidoglycan transglycosylase [Pseudochryseolinea flava]|uniref:Biosynthetic peptidoglycan transglycosylase n=1 Tax=Pseudochryseolinea flava TaxID=2059302 RepID=A0A364XYT0_9BACT|nr:monofunctional biosynthetic peptidoglycan transglycosylase [Pseudochryseolinea flava]RAV98589.1 monofunctional biosynthetic peptidoglycan transglycosylase [Pseudochryseolinea flava]